MRHIRLIFTVPLLKDNNHRIIGAIGVSGGSVEQDHDVAIAGASVLLFNEHN